MLHVCDFLDGNEQIQTHGHKLPHWQQGEVIQFVTFRLGDAMPVSKLSIWKGKRDIWLQHHPGPWDLKTTKEYHRKFTDQLERWLDQGSGSCLFKESSNRLTLERTFMYDQENRAQHHAWVIMPNHVHLLFTPKIPLPKLIKSWKGVSARKMGQGSIWQRNYRDTLIRDGSHFANAIRYIRRNPKNLPQGTFALWESARSMTVK
jgi:REP element-mobilizing transposase RayT